MDRKETGKGCNSLFVLKVLSIALTVGIILVVVPAFAADCLDTDGDGYVVCDGACTVPEGKICGDCNDANNLVNPAATEICGDGIDNDCQSGALEPGGQCLVCPAGDPDPACYAFVSGICRTMSFLACSGDNLSLVCPEPSEGYDMPSVEDWSIPATCTDLSDNDCDGLTDEFKNASWDKIRDEIYRGRGA